MKNPDKTKWEHNNRLDQAKSYNRMESNKNQSKKAKETFLRKPYEVKSK